jgi:hypothetical protein
MNKAIQAKIKPGTEKQLFTSTMPEDKECGPKAQRNG